MYAPSDPLLIVLLPQPSDLARARDGHYRVPLAHAPASLARAQALLFYQPASFGERRWRIEWQARVRHLDLRPRHELIPDEPEHPRAAELYVQVALEAVVPLEPPLSSQKGRRLLFVETTGARLQRVATLDELLDRALRPIADDLLYRLLDQQLQDRTGLPDPDKSHQPRLFETRDRSTP